MEFTLERVCVDLDEDGRQAISSCRIGLKKGGTFGGMSQGYLGPSELAILETLRDSFFEDGATSSELRGSVDLAKQTYHR